MDGHKGRPYLKLTHYLVTYALARTALVAYSLGFEILTGG